MVAIQLKDQDEATEYMKEYLRQEGRAREIRSLNHLVLALYGGVKKGWGWHLRTSHHEYNLWPDGEVEIRAEKDTSGKWQRFPLSARS